ncbi:FMRFamide receptor-like isoform X2 [Tigriopus californicus]|uniref:FMRFamide receptor-like isoform X2 n=1 Tax=Tigriopus californicus TaxID=6832 RepID=UPI0027DA501D|nr:FMRFamide receptor-like isoform X2 [Tigriopus californicus]
MLARNESVDLNGTASPVELWNNVTEDAEGDWINGTETTTESIYYITPPSDPSLLNCVNIMLKSDIKILMDWKWWLTGVVSTVILIIGFIGNVFAVIVLHGPKMTSAFNQLLITLCIFDTIFLVCNIATSLSSLGFKHDVMPVLTKCSDAVAHVSMCASVLMIVALTFERHFAICNPHKYRIHLRTTPRWKHLAMYIAPVTIFSLFFNIPMFINLQRRWMTNALYVKINLYLRAIHPLTTTGLAPVAILIVLNVRICRGIQILHQRRTSRNRKELNMAYIAIVIVSLFVISNMPRILAGAQEVTNTHLIIHCIENKTQYIPSMDFYKLDFVARLLMVINSSINFLVYCAVSTPFKRAFYDLLTPACVFCPGFLKCLSRSGSTGGRQVNGAPRGEFESSDDLTTYPGIMMTTTTTTVVPIGRGHSNLTSTRNSPEGDGVPRENGINSSQTHKIPNGIHAQANHNQLNDSCPRMLEPISASSLVVITQGSVPDKLLSQGDGGQRGPPPQSLSSMCNNNCPTLETGSSIHSSQTLGEEDSEPADNDVDPKSGCPSLRIDGSHSNTEAKATDIREEIDGGHSRDPRYLPDVVQNYSSQA